MTRMESKNSPEACAGDEQSKGGISLTFLDLGASNLVQGAGNNTLRRRLESSARVQEKVSEERGDIWTPGGGH